MKIRRICFPSQETCIIEDSMIHDHPGKGEILVETLSSLISPGTELNLFTGRHSGISDPQNKWAKYPFYPGYASCGEVKAVGEGVTELSKGMKVFYTMPHASALIIKEEDLIKVPDNVSAEAACFAKLMSISMNGIRVADISLGEGTVIFGQGLIGLFAAAFAKMSGAYPLVTCDTNQERLKLSLKSGADLVINPATENLGEILKELSISTAIEASGVSALIPEAAKILPMGGKLILLGSPHQSVNMNFYTDIHCRQISVIGAHENGSPLNPSHHCPWTKKKNIELSLALISEGRINPELYVTDRIPADQAAELYSKIAGRDPRILGAILDWKNLASSTTKAILEEAMAV